MGSVIGLNDIHYSLLEMGRVKSQDHLELDEPTVLSDFSNIEPNIHPELQLPLKRSIENDNAGPSSKRHKNEEQKVRLHDLPATEFASKVKLFSGPQIGIHIDGVDFKVSKALLCYYSPYFDDALNGFENNFKEEITYEGCKVSTFELVIQWLYLGHITLPVHEALTRRAEEVSQLESEVEAGGNLRKKGLLKSAVVKKKAAESLDIELKITTCVDFLSLAGEIDLLGPFDSVIDIIKEIFIADPASLKSGHLHLAMNLPCTHPIRLLFIRIAAGHYMDYMFGEDATFKHQNELKDLPGFEKEMLLEFAKSFSAKTNFVNGKRSEKTHRFQITTPSGDGSYTITAEKLF